MQYSLRFAFCLLFLTSILPGQQRTPGIGGQNPGAGAGNTGVGPGPGTMPGTTGIPGNIPGQPNPNSVPGNFPEPTQTPIFLSGKVVMEDGTPPPVSVSIQRECSSFPRTVAYTNAKGQFNFQWDNFAGITPDASESGFGGRSTPGIPSQRAGSGGSIEEAGTGRSMFGCDLVASAAGFRSDRINLAGHRPTDNPDVGMIVLHRLTGVQGTSVSASSLAAPKDARKAWEKGVQMMQKSKSADAEKEFEKAVAIYPNYANAWLDLGRVRQQQHSDEPARDAFLKAIGADDKLVDPYVALGEMSAHAQSWPDAARYLDRALDLDPVDYPRLWFEDAVADYNVQNFDRAEKNAREAAKLPAPQLDPRSQQLLGLVLINKRDYTGAREALQTYLRLSPAAPDQAQVKQQISQIDSQLGASKQ